MQARDSDSGEGAAKAAAAYLAKGWSIIPLRARTKRPLVPWRYFQTARPSAGQLRDWFREWPDANVGIVTGEISRLIVIDIDPKHGGDDSRARLEAQFGPLPPTVEAITGGGGRHLYFLHPGGHVGNRAGWRQGIDLRGDGGYIVAPPSVHPTGARYRWLEGQAPSQIELAPLPPWVLYGAGGMRRTRSLEDWRSLVREGVAEGERNSTIASLSGHLLWHEVDPGVVLELMLAWNAARCRPPLDPAEVSQVVQNIVRLHEERDERAAPAPGEAGR